MTNKTILATAAALLLGVSTPAFAKFTLNGTAVPADQVDRIQQHCDLLQSNEGAVSTSSDAGSSAANADAAVVGEIDFATLDLNTIDIEACRAGGFLDDADAGADNNNSTGVEGDIDPDDAGNDAGN